MAKKAPRKGNKKSLKVGVSKAVSGPKIMKI